MNKDFLQNNKYNKYLIIFSIIVFMDFVAKILANNLLPYKETVIILENNICFYLTYNVGSIGSLGSILLSKLPIKNLIILLNGINSIIISIYILRVKKFQFDKILKWVFGFALYYLLFFPEFLIVFLFKNIHLSNHFVSWFSILGVIIFCLTVFFNIRDDKIRLILTFIIGAGFGNLISHFYPPYYVIDFIYVKFLYDCFRIGILNFADMIYYLSLLSLVIYSIFIGFKKIFQG
jgi:hypothetical protein